MTERNSGEGVTLLCYKIHDFKNAALHMEREIEAYELTHDPQVPGIDKLIWNYNPWISKKTVSMFNLGIALELMLKLFLVLSEQEKPREHKLTTLYDCLPSSLQDELEDAYKKEFQKNLDVGTIVAFIDHPIPRPNRSPPRKQPDISTLRGFFEFFDSDVLLYTKRYSWEGLSEYKWHYYIGDIFLFVNLIDYVMNRIGARYSIPISPQTYMRHTLVRDPQ